MIGEIIKEQRTSMDMSRKTLSEGICTEKYVYLIEKNERNPSAYILNHFSERMGIDLFEYYQYLNFENIPSVVEHKKNFERFIQLGDIEKLKEEAIKASKLEDFKVEPLSYDITMINLTYKSLIEGKTGETIEELKEIFKNKKLNIDQLTLINSYIVLSSCYQIEGQLDKAKEVLEIVYKMIENKAGFSRYNTAIITVLLSLTSYFYNVGKYDELIKYSKKLIEFQEEYNQFNRIYYGEFYLSFAYYKTNKILKSKEHFMRAIHAASLFKNEMTMNFFKETGIFDEVVENLDINQFFIDQFYEISKSN